MMLHLTSSQVDHYHERGYVELGRLFDDDTLERLRQEELRFRGYPQISLADKVTPLPDTSTLFRNQVANYSAIVRDIFLRGPQVPVLGQILGDLVVGNFTQFVTKLPDSDLARAEFPWHQDSGYGNKNNPLHVTIWCALDKVDESNGCVWIIPGSHRQGLIPHVASGKSWHVTVKTDEEGVPVRLNAGEAVAFSGFTLHRSLTNDSDRPRRAFFMEYSDYLGDAAENRVQLNVSPLWIVQGQLPYPVPVRECATPESHRQRDSSS